MVVAHMNLASSPSPSPNSSTETENTNEIYKLLYIWALVIVGVLALFLLHVLGSLRRRSSHNILHAIVRGVYMLSYTLVGYTLGLMKSSRYYVDEFPVWAVCLLLFLGSTDYVTAYSLDDIDNWKSFYVKHLVLGAWVVLIIVRYGPEPYYKAPVWAMLAIIAIKTYARIASFRMASKKYLGKNVKRIADYMKMQVPPVEEPNRWNPKTMEGYKYVVVGERMLKNYGVKQPDHEEQAGVRTPDITTVEDVWKCKGSLLSSERGLLLKDFCLSMALSNMLNRRFAGFELAEAGLAKTRDFVFRGLLAEGTRGYERPFRVIEEELAFVHDLYYTRYPYLYHKGRYFPLYLPVVMVLLCSWLTYKLAKSYQKHKNCGPCLTITTTLFLMAMLTFLEAFQLYLYMASGWFKVALIRSYVTREQWQNPFVEKIIGLLLILKAFHPWEDRLGQYSLLHAFHFKPSNCLHCVTLFLVDKAKKGRKKRRLVKLSTEVKQAVIDSLIRSNGHLTNGVRSLEKNGVHEQLSWACQANNEPVAYTILVWHVATTLCKHEADAGGGRSPLPLSEEDKRNSSVASGLSQYCAYLVAFAPNLLPDHSSVSASVLSASIKEASKLLGGATKMQRKYDELMRIGRDAGPDDKRLVVLGARLARQLLVEDIQDPTLRWRVLSEFWAEMMLYVAPSNDARAHLEALPRGGEFITHLWALLTHAGVLTVERRPAEEEGLTVS